MTYIHHYYSPFGGITIAGSGEAITGLWFDGQKYFGSTVKGETQEKYLPVFGEAVRWLDIYFSGKDPGFTPPLYLETTPFQEVIYNILLRIPFGCRATYGEIADIAAKQLGRKQMSAQAVGGAVGHNPISLIIPCHRVTGAGGKLTGYAAGTDIKKSLLELERNQ